MNASDMERHWRICYYVFGVLTVASFADPECSEVSYLEVGREGIISCSLGPFYAVSWYTKEEYDVEGSPLIYFNEVKTGKLKEYNVYPNGSLIIRNVSFNHAGSYVVTLLEYVTSDEVMWQFCVEVYAVPNPPYPVVNQHMNQQHVYMDVNRDGELSCSMRGVYPRVNLSWTVVDPSQSDKIQFQHEVQRIIQNEDDLFDVVLSSSYKVTDYSIQGITIKCGVSEEMDEFFPAKTTVDLLFSPVYPMVNGHVNQKHVYLDVDRRGHLTCVKENVDTDTTLLWELVHPSIRDKISFQSRAVVSNNNDGTRNINQTFQYEVHDHSLERITVECKIMKPDASELLTTTVDLLFQNVYPVVNGHVNQKHVYLDVERQGHLTCVKENVGVGTTLVWELDPAIKDKVNFQSPSVMSINDDGTVNINQTFGYAVRDNCLKRVIVECKLLEPDSDEHPYKTTVDLLFPSDGECNKSSQGTLDVFSLLTMVLVIALVLIVSIFYYCNRRHYKETSKQIKRLSMRNLPVNYETAGDSAVILSQDSNSCKSAPADSGNSGSNARERSENESSEKETSKQIKRLSMRNLPVNYETAGDSAVILSQDSNSCKSAPADSGNSGSNARERSENESSEKSHLIEDSSTKRCRSVSFDQSLLNVLKPTSLINASRHLSVASLMEDDATNCKRLAEEL